MRAEKKDKELYTYCFILYILKMFITLYIHFRLCHHYRNLLSCNRTVNEDKSNVPRYTVFFISPGTLKCLTGTAILLNNLPSSDSWN